MCTLLAWHLTPPLHHLSTHTLWMVPWLTLMILYFRLNLDHSSVQDVQSFKTATSLEKHEKSHKEDIYTDQHVVLLVKSATEMCITNGIHDENIISTSSSYQINIKSITALKDYLNSLHSNKQC